MSENNINSKYSILRKFAIIAILMTSITSYAQHIPNVEDVGPAAMPKQIASITAPFDFPQLSKPDFGQRRSVIKLKKGQKATKSIQAAIERMAKQGGGTVVVPQGKWTTGRIELKSRVCLEIPRGAELHFTGDIIDYQPEVFTRDEGMELYSTGAYIYANGQENIGITGDGVISGVDPDCELYTRNQSMDLDPEVLVDKTPLEKRHFNGIDTKEVFLPKSISPINCRNVLIEGVTLRNTLYWNIVPQYCENVVIRGVTVESYGHGRTDGLDVESCKNTLVEYCSLDCGDDCYTIKSGRGKDGIRVNRPTENVVIRYCLAKRGAGALVLGSETAGNMNNIYMHDCVFTGTSQGFRFKTRRPRGGGGHDITIERIRASLKGRAFYNDMLGSVRWAGNLAMRLPAQPVGPLTPDYHSIRISDVVIDSCSTLIDVQSLPEMPLRNVLLTGWKARCQKFMKMHDVKGFVMENCHIDAKDPKAEIDGCEGIMMLNCTTTNPPVWQYGTELPSTKVMAK